MKPGQVFAAIATLVVGAAVVAGLWSIGSPSAQRQQRLDARRVADLIEIDVQVRAWQKRHDALPPDLATLAAQPGLRLTLTDPVDGSAYDYVADAGGRYRLCAMFATDTAETGGAASGWTHGRGRTCFERRIEAADAQGNAID
ncbi:hypothetical protein P873_09505 [Arenimonas composti TR7-09 = DSM 18010]|uniref:Type II secretion system protein GspG C-terminal domain-containing protein n=2 Tax=Arenimonas TaxID=490567 RepID=A0A091BDF8_9GAMM|nr:hypothetical protein P873_09505 [Arenimonas composti TR7-09 = DSM 18010]